MLCNEDQSNSMYRREHGVDESLCQGLKEILGVSQFGESG